MATKVKVAIQLSSCSIFDIVKNIKNDDEMAIFNNIYYQPNPRRLHGDVITFTIFAILIF